MRRIWMAIVVFGIGGYAVGAQERGASLSEERRRDSNRVHVQFDDCTEFAGLQAVPVGNVRDRVPSQYRLAGETDGIGIVVFRMASCHEVSVNGSHPRPAIVAQVGVNVIAPLGTGDINNYTLYFATDSALLFVRLRLAGINVLFAPGLDFEYSPDPSGPCGSLFIDVPRPRSAMYELTGPACEPVPLDPGFPFVANWWFAARDGDVIMETTIPNIRFGDASGVMATTDPDSDLASILGGTSMTFPILAVRGVFGTATLDVRPEPF
jgi:hypothetical protein